MIANVRWLVTMRTKSLATGFEATQANQVEAPDEATARQLAARRTSRAHGRVVVTEFLSCEQIGRPAEAPPAPWRRAGLDGTAMPPDDLLRRRVLGPFASNPV